MLDELEKLKLEDLNVGDEVCVSYETSYGWNRFRYPTFKEGVVTRITPKKTKAVVTLRGGGTIDCDRYRGIYKCSDATRKMNELSARYKYISSNIFDLDRNVSFNKLSDEEIMVVADKLKEIVDITSKYKKEV